MRQVKKAPARKLTPIPGLVSFRMTNRVYTVLGILRESEKKRFLITVNGAGEEIGMLCPVRVCDRRTFFCVESDVDLSVIALLYV